MLDFGLLGFARPAPEWALPGAGVAGEVALELDPDEYRTGFAHKARLPASIYPWHIDRAVLEHAQRAPARPKTVCGAGTRI